MTRYAIIGAGMMGGEHIRNIALLPGATVSAVVEPDGAMREATRELCERSFGQPPLFVDEPAELGRRDLADAAVVAAPNHEHLPVMRQLLKTYMPVLCEKPFGLDANEAMELLSRARHRRAPVWVAMEYRYMPPVARLIQAVREKERGRLGMLSIREHRFPFLPKVGDWNRFQANTGGTLVEKCCHFFDLMRLITGSEPTRIYASGSGAVNHLDEDYGGRRPDILDNAFVTVDFASGVRASLDLCMFGEGSRWQEIVTATCEHGALAALVPGPGRFEPARPDGERVERTAEFRVTDRATKWEARHEMEVPADVLAAGDHHGSTFEQHRRFRGMMATQGSPEVTMMDGAIAVVVGAAAEESVRSGQAIDLRPRLDALRGVA